MDYIYTWMGDIVVYSFLIFWNDQVHLYQHGGFGWILPWLVASARTRFSYRVISLFKLLIHLSFKLFAHPWFVSGERKKKSFSGWKKDKHRRREKIHITIPALQKCECWKIKFPNYSEYAVLVRKREIINNKLLIKTVDIFIFYGGCDRGGANSSTVTNFYPGAWHVKHREI